MSVMRTVKVGAVAHRIATTILVLTASLGKGMAQTDLAQQRRALQDDLATQRAVAIAVERRIANEREKQLFDQLSQRDTQYRQLARDQTRTQHERDGARSELAKVVAERDRLVNQISQRDRDYANEVNEFRRQIGGLTETANPALQAALQRYADGDRVGALPVIDQIIRAENRAAEVATNIRAAVKLRQVASLALDMKDRGELSTSDVLTRWEEVQKLDPGHHWGWVELRRLYAEAGQLQDARRAADQALATAADARARSVALNELGDVLVASGELAAARARFEEGLVIRQGLVEANRASAAAQRDVSISLNRLGDVLVATGDLATARARFEESLLIRSQLANANPASAAAQRDLAMSLERLGDVLVAAGDLATAKERFQKSLVIREGLAEANRASTAAKRDVSVSLNKLGGVLMAAGELVPARVRFEHSSAILQQLAKANPASAAAQRDVLLSYVKLGEATGEKQWWRAALEVAERLSREGRLAPRDAGLMLFLLEKARD